MSLKVMKVTEDAVKFTLSGVSVGFANAIRRIMIAEVPTMSVETVEVSDNTVGALLESLTSN